MVDLDLRQWLKESLTVIESLIDSNFEGDFSFKLKPTRSRCELDQLLSCLGTGYGHGLEFLKDFYTIVGCGFSIEINANDRPSADAVLGLQYYAHFEVCEPHELLELSVYNKSRVEDISGRFFDGLCEDDIRESARKSEIFSKEYDRLILEFSTLQSIIGECLMFSRDNTGGGIAYYCGNRCPPGVYSVGMTEAKLIAKTMEGFFVKIKKHGFKAPVSTINWDSD